MSGMMTWLCMGIAMVFAAGIWFAYLVRIVLNEEVVLERKRRRMRERELERRRREDRADRKARRQA